MTRTDPPANEIGRQPRSGLTRTTAGRRWRGRDAPSARASLASSATRPTHRATRLTRPSFGASTPTRIPTPATRVPLTASSSAFTLVMPLVGLVGANPGRLAPFGGVERPRRVVRFGRLIDRRGRAVGRPSAGAVSWPPTATGPGAGRCRPGGDPARPGTRPRSRSPTCRAQGPPRPGTAYCLAINPVVHHASSR